MIIDKTALQRLNDALEARRLELRLTWREVARKAEITSEGLRGIRNGASGRVLTRRKLEDALGWPGGEIDRILAGPQLDPTDAELAAMTVDEAKAYIIRVGKARGVEAAKQARRRIQEAWDRALLVEEPGNR